MTSKQRKTSRAWLRVAPLAAGGVLLAACHSGGNSATEGGLPAGSLVALRGTWLLLPEASRADTLVYRRNTYRFRYRPGGRPGFRLGAAGRFTRYDLAPGGGLLAREGTWVEETPEQLRVHLPEMAVAEPDYLLTLLSYRNGQLKLRQTPAGKPSP